MIVEPPQKQIRFTARNGFAEYVLFDGVCPLGNVQRRHPKSWPRCQSPLRFSSMPVGEIERNEERRVGVDAQ
jgi:hypothetical protein